MKHILTLVLVLTFFGFAATASAQVVRNPTVAVITVGPDHAQITRYELGWFLGAAVDPVQLADIGTGEAVAGDMAKPLPSYPIGVTYTAKVRGYVNTISSDWSPTSNPFYRTPAAPLGVAVR